MVDYIIIFSEEQMLKSSPAKSIPVRLYLERVKFDRLVHAENLCSVWKLAY